MKRVLTVLTGANWLKCGQFTPENRFYRRRERTKKNKKNLNLIWDIRPSLTENIAKTAIGMKCFTVQERGFTHSASLSKTLNLPLVLFLFWNHSKILSVLKSSTFELLHAYTKLFFFLAFGKWHLTLNRNDPLLHQLLIWHCLKIWTVEFWWSLDYFHSWFLRSYLILFKGVSIHLRSCV